MKNRTLVCKLCKIKTTGICYDEIKVNFLNLVIKFAESHNCFFQSTVKIEQDTNSSGKNFPEGLILRSVKRPFYFPVFID